MLYRYEDRGLTAEVNVSLDILSDETEMSGPSSHSVCVPHRKRVELLLWDEASPTWPMSHLRIYHSNLCFNYKANPNVKLNELTASGRNHSGTGHNDALEKIAVCLTQSNLLDRLCRIVVLKCGREHCYFSSTEEISNYQSDCLLYME